MSDCVRLEACGFFHGNLEEMPATAEVFKNRYCRDDWQSCARYQVSKAVGAGRVPATLFPNMTDRVAEVIREIKADMGVI